MTATTTNFGILPVEAAPLSAVTFDLYRNIHKGIRRGLFTVTSAFGSVDSGDADAVARAATELHELVHLLVSHAEHEDTFVQPAIDRFLPTIADRVGEEQEALEQQMASLEVLAAVAAGASPGDCRLDVHRVYLGLTTFSAAYLEHQAFEELEIMPGLSQAMRVEELIEMHTAILNSIAPADMGYSLTLMLPAMNVDDRAEMLAGMRDAPSDVVQGVLGLAAAVLTPDELAKTKVRAGIS
jgi:Hemerythrin HHE cation binding domain